MVYCKINNYGVYLNYPQGLGEIKIKGRLVNMGVHVCRIRNLVRLTYRGEYREEFKAVDLTCRDKEIAKTTVREIKRAIKEGYGFAICQSVMEQGYAAVMDSMGKPGTEVRG